MNKLTEKQFDKIINRFTSKTIYPKAYLMHPAQSKQHIIASNAHILLFLSKHIVSDTINPERFLTDEEGKSLLSLNSKYMDNRTQSPNMLTLDKQLIESIISSLKQHKKELRTRTHAYTRISYSKYYNELTLSTYSLSPKSPEFVKESFYRPASVSDDITDFNILLNANYLIDALQTQLETDQFTSLEYFSNYIRLVNDNSTAIIAKLKE